MKLQELKTIASKYGITYKGNISASKLEQLIRTYCEDNGLDFNILAQESVMSEEIKEVEPIITFESLEASQKKTKHINVRNDANRLVRCVVTCHNSDKANMSGELFSAGNKSVDFITKYVPFGVPWYIPQVLVNAIKEKKYTRYIKEHLPDGSTKRSTTLAPAYNVEILGPISQEELEGIRKKQLAEGKGD